MWFKYKSTCLASTRPCVQILVPPKKKKNQKERIRKVFCEPKRILYDVKHLGKEIDLGIYQTWLSILARN
jgi:hypothetical protein